MIQIQPVVPKEAASVLLLNSQGDELLWARRNPALKFLGGFHSFPGGKVDASDADCPVKNCGDPEIARLIACAARETFEEVGVLLVRNGERLTKGQLPLLHDDLVSGRSTFARILSDWGLWLDAEDFDLAGVWTTPEFSPMRFRTSFFVARCPAKQTPYAAITELQEIEFVDPRSALRLWAESKVLVAPPVLSALKAQAGLNSEENNDESLSNIFGLEAAARKHGPHFIELNSRLVCLPLRTKTLPPATHTNCFIIGRKRFLVIDAATPFPEEQEKLTAVVDKMIDQGNECVAIIVSHLHPDHFGGETVLKRHLFDRYGSDIPIAAHPVTIRSLEGKVVFDSETLDSYDLQDDRGANFKVDVLHTPGHARGHLCFYDREYGFLLSSDNVVGQGTVVIAPPEGNMTDYLKSLDMMRSLPGLRSLAGSHGAAISDGKSRIDSYIQHRLERENQIADSISNGAQSIDAIVAEVYPELNSFLIPYAEKSVEAHLDKLISEGLIRRTWSDH